MSLRSEAARSGKAPLMILLQVLHAYTWSAKEAKLAEEVEEEDR